MGHTGAVTCLTSAGLELTGMELLLTGSADCTAMLWRLQRTTAKTKRPCMIKRPDRVLLGHTAPIVACAIYYDLGVTLTASGTELIIHHIEHISLVRRIDLPASLAARGLRFRHCLLSPAGFAIAGMQSGDGGGNGGNGQSRVQVWTKNFDTFVCRSKSFRANPVSCVFLQVWTVNGNIVAERESAAAIAHMAVLGRGNVLMTARRDGIVEFLDLNDLALVGSYRLVFQVPPPGAELPRLVCADAGPEATTPMMMACGTDVGSLVVVGLPLIHHVKELKSANAFANTLLHVPIKIVKDTLNFTLNTFGKVSTFMYMHRWPLRFRSCQRRPFLRTPGECRLCGVYRGTESFRLSRLRKRWESLARRTDSSPWVRQAKGIAHQAQGVAIEAFGEAKTIVRDVRNKGLGGLVGYFTKGGGSS
jgi:hypothetical protein